MTRHSPRGGGSNRVSPEQAYICKFTATLTCSISQSHLQNARFEVSTVVKIQVDVFCFMTPRSDAVGR
jgi:hypothetical protein